MLITDKNDIELFRMLTLHKMLKLEIQGLKFRTSALSVLKKEGYTGNRKQVYEKLSKDLGK
jgi:hypothetical protein